MSDLDKMKPKLSFFLGWSFTALICLFLQMYVKYNLGILVILLMIPMFIHDILLLFVKKLQGGETK